MFFSSFLTIINPPNPMEFKNGTKRLISPKFLTGKMLFIDFNLL